jgi:hypothetical protein
MRQPMAQQEKKRADRHGAAHGQYDKSPTQGRTRWCAALNRAQIGGGGGLPCRYAELYMRPSASFRSGNAPALLGIRAEGLKPTPDNNQGHRDLVWVNLIIFQSKLRQHASQDLQPKVLFVARSVGAALKHTGFRSEGRGARKICLSRTATPGARHSLHWQMRKGPNDHRWRRMHDGSPFQRRKDGGRYRRNVRRNELVIENYSDATHGRLVLATKARIELIMQRANEI